MPIMLNFRDLRSKVNWGINFVIVLSGLYGEVINISSITSKF